MRGRVLSAGAGQAPAAHGNSVRRGALEREVVQRLGLLPNFLRSAPSVPGLVEQFWAFAKSAYLDNPLPPLFKERLFVHLSRFCGVRSCISRHIALLVGRGRPAGGTNAAPETIAQVAALIGRPLADAAALDQALLRLEALREPSEIPEPGTAPEADLFDALSMLFVAPGQTKRARLAIRNAFGDTKLELLTALLAFVRTEHYWSETHPHLEDEPEVSALMRANPELAALLPDMREAQRAQERIRGIGARGGRLAPTEGGEEQGDRLLAEWQHRVRNTIAVIRSIVRRTAETSETVEDFANHLDGRIGAFSRVQLAVARDPLAGFDLAELLYEEFRACAAHEGEQFSLQGPPVRLGPKAAENIGLAIHELATNAVKHGAFTIPRGRIDVGWSKELRQDGDWLWLSWKESGMAGRPVEQSRQGFGTILLEQTLQYDLGAEVTRAFEFGGFRCEITFPLAESGSR